MSDYLIYNLNFRFSFYSYKCNTERFLTKRKNTSSYWELAYNPAIILKVYKSESHNSSTIEKLSFCIIISLKLNLQNIVLLN